MLDGYRVQPEGVAGVLSDSATADAAIARAVRPLPNDLAEAGSSADGTSGDGLISSALQSLGEQVASGVWTARARLASASQGLSTATQAVSAGDEAMGDQIQSQAATAFARRFGRASRAD